MITISLCMIVRDEEDVLARCLKSVRGIPDEIIIVDTGSLDRTKEIALEMGAKVFDFAWIDNFSAARNASFDQATMDYILWLDADDVLDEENRQAFIALKETLDPALDTVMMRYHVAFDKAGRPTYTFFRERLVRRAAGMRWKGCVHEAIDTRGNAVHSDIAVRHEKMKQGDPGRNLRIYEKMLAQGEALEPRHRYYYARELFANGRDEEAIALLDAIIDDENTWVENRIEACRDLSLCYLRAQNLDRALLSLARSFALGGPRAEICCDMGGIWLDRGRYEDAIFWYKVAPECPPSDKSGGFALPDSRGYIPYLQLCLCYDHIGRHDLAELYNDKAGLEKPGDRIVARNRDFFQKRREGAS